MNSNDYIQKASRYLNTLCSVKPNRRTGSSGNRKATAFVAKLFRQWGYAVDTAPFSCLDFKPGTAVLSCGKSFFDVLPSHFSLGCDVTAALITVSTVDELKRCECRGKILLVRGLLAEEPLMPKNFIFYNPDHHKQIYALLEKKRPAAIITATVKNPGLAGGENPFCMIEDGDFHIPSVFCKDTVGRKIARMSGAIFHLKSGARRIPSTACNVIARKKPGSKAKTVICGHIDARANTPGATDDATGIVIELLLAEMLKDEEVAHTLEFVAFNGEDYYSVGGQMDYLHRYGKELRKITVAVNCDDIGYKKGKSAFSLYGCPAPISRKARKVFLHSKGIMEGEQWYQGDHMIFVQKGVPAIAFTAQYMAQLMATITHTPKDTPGIVDVKKLVEVACALKGFVTAFELVA